MPPKDAARDAAQGETVHAVAFLVGETGFLAVGPSGSGKSLLVATSAMLWREDPVRLVADDRVRLSVRSGRLIARPVEGFLGLMELRGFGMATHAAMPSAVLRACICLLPEHPPRMPEQAIETMAFLGISLPALKLRGGADAGQAFMTRLPAFRSLANHLA